MKKIIFILLSYFFIIWNTLALEPKITTWDKKLIEWNDWNWVTQILGFLWDIFSKDTFIKIILSLVVIWLTFIITKIVKVKLTHILEKQADWDTSKEEVFWMIVRTVNIMIIISGFSLAMGILWVNLGLFMWGIWFWIWFTLKTFLTNFIAWIIMLTNGNYSSWVLLEIAWKKWRIVKVNSLMTELEQFDWVRFLIPNIKFLEEPVSNFHTNDKRRLEVFVTIDYDSDVLKAKMLASKVINSLPNILQAPEPSIIITELWQNWIQLKIMAWISSKDNYFRARSNLAETINLAYKKAWIKIPFQQITISNRDQKT
jgi:small conductance mechanosensitive channel